MQPNILEDRENEGGWGRGTVLLHVGVVQCGSIRNLWYTGIRRQDQQAGNARERSRRLVRARLRAPLHRLRRRRPPPL